MVEQIVKSSLNFYKIQCMIPQGVIRVDFKRYQTLDSKIQMLKFKEEIKNKKKTEKKKRKYINT